MEWGPSVHQLVRQALGRNNRRIEGPPRMDSGQEKDMYSVFCLAEQTFMPKVFVYHISIFNQIQQKWIISVLGRGTTIEMTIFVLCFH